jgi:hypothetical protein
MLQAWCCKALGKPELRNTLLRLRTARQGKAYHLVGGEELWCTGKSLVGIFQHCAGFGDFAVYQQLGELKRRSIVNTFCSVKGTISYTVNRLTLQILPTPPQAPLSNKRPSLTISENSSLSNSLTHQARLFAETHKNTHVTIRCPAQKSILLRTKPSGTCKYKNTT